MRPVGSRRGNTMVRFLVDQAARRRLFVSLAPSQIVEGEPAADQWSARWSRRFYDHVRRRLVPRMTVVDHLSEGELRWYGGASIRLWALVDVHATLIAIEHGETPVTLADRARRWCTCLSTRTAPGLASPHWGHPVYGARIDTRSGELDVVWAAPGDWCGLVMGASLPPSKHVRPPSWVAAPVAV